MRLLRWICEICYSVREMGYFLMPVPLAECLGLDDSHGMAAIVRLATPR